MLNKSEIFREKRWLFFVGIKAMILNNRKLLLLSSGPLELSSTKRNRIFWDMPVIGEYARKYSNI